MRIVGRANAAPYDALRDVGGYATRAARSSSGGAFIDRYPIGGDCVLINH